MPTLSFKGKTAVESYHLVVPHHTLDFDKKLSLTKTPSLDGNLIIEGDNLLALKSLLPTHAGKVKCIYIDPPYNTGNEGWVFNDNLTQPQFKEWIGRVVGKEGEDATRHDKWCCMMYPRLQLLRELLCDEGIIFVSIDDIELFRLKLLMDEVFGEDRFIVNIVWKARQYPDARAKTGVSTDHEYVLAYGKSLGCRLRGGERDETKYSNPDSDEGGPWMSRSILGLAAKDKRPNLHHTIIDRDTGNEYDPPAETGWRYDRTTMKKKIKEGRIIFPKTADGRPREKVFLQELQTKFPGFPSIISDVHTADGTEEIRRIFGTGVFTFPKPSDLIRRLLQQATNDDDIVLDSFSGSATTAHAILSLNKEDESNRRFILVQMPYETKEQEKDKLNICEKVTAERVRRVSKGYAYTTPKGKQEKVAGLGGEFTYARVGKMLFDQFHNFPEGQYPSFEELARYIFYTETSRSFDPKGLDEKSGKIGEHGGRSYYLLYTPNGEADRALTREWLEEVSQKDKNPKVVYCEKIWLHRDELAEFGNVRAMVVPFNLK